MKAVLLDCEKIERLAAEIYQRLSRQPGFREPVRTTFTRLAEDERAHAIQLALAVQWADPALGMAKRISGQKVAEGLEKIQGLMRELEWHAASEEAALKMAIDLEKSFIRIHLDNAVYFSEPRIAQLFEALGRQDDAHLATLQDCLTWWQSQRRLDAE